MIKPNFLNPRREREKINCESCEITVDDYGCFICRNCYKFFPRKDKVLLREMIKSTSEENAILWLKALKRSRIKALKGKLEGRSTFIIVDEFGITEDHFYDEKI